MTRFRKDTQAQVQGRENGLKGAADLRHKKHTLIVLDQNIRRLREAILETQQLLKDLCTELANNERDLRRCLADDRSQHLLTPRSFSPDAVPPVTPPWSANGF